ncbi:MAG: hypothetical protein ABI416_08910 [Ginsengibacter sp.]
MKNTGIKIVLLLALQMVTPGLVNSQVHGCTDVLANNYNAVATVNDGSCTYNQTSYIPVIKVDPIADSLLENSGLQMAGNYLWSFNDGQNANELYRIDTATNTLLQRVILSGTTNVDWEDIAFDGTYFYIGDFGNNSDGARTDLVIYKFPLSAIPYYGSNPVANIPSSLISTIRFSYSDQPQPPAAAIPNNTKFDCEAMLVDNGKIHLFSKNWIDKNSTHYIINSTAAGIYIAEHIETLATNYLVTAADKINGQNIIVLLGYQNTGTGNHYLHILSDYKADSFFSGNRRRIDLPDALTMGQSEGITFRNGKYGYISNEKFVKTVGPFTVTVDQKLRSFNISNFVTDHFTTYLFKGNGNWSDSTNWQYNLPPPPKLLQGNEIVIDPIAAGICELNIPYTLPAGAKLTVKKGKKFILSGNLVAQ